MLSVRLISLRKSHKKTQQDVADYLGLTRPAYTAYERGNRQPDYTILQKLADYYDVSTDYLLGRSDNPGANPVVVAGEEINLTAEELQLFNELKKHPVMFHDLASDPEKKVKELLKMYKMKKMFLEDEEEQGDGFGDLED
ncbi:transcriptional regulator [Sporosarcina sp. P18a]|uniref:helix-turn-helix domain-containing protein n=1 Tax=Sporosarcina sp. P18a TaxID=2048259 RepID=UPI000C16FB62|nr:helix-turn-helix transcriptional regulator [Sporosarcina sp. P18a]PIC81072.1 transcriptional regulator [Sporosarcina sp. P18a]